MKDSELIRHIQKFALLLVMLLGGLSQSSACDVCGCNLGGYYFGILPNGQMHFVGLRYQVATFNAHIDNRLFEDEYSEDTYRRMDIIGGISISRRFMVTFNLPYSLNTMDGSHQNVRSNGIGDPSLMIYFKPFRSPKTGQKLKQNLMVGLGAKFPIAEFDKTDKGSIVNRNFQLGTGSMDYLMAYNYTLSYGNHAINVEGSIKLNTENELDYKFGNQANASLNYYWSQAVGKWVLMPYTGLSFEYSEKHLDKEITQRNTGGNVTLGNIGAQVFMKQLVLTTQFQIPLKQKYNVDEISTIEANNRFLIGINYNFMSK